MDNNQKAHHPAGIQASIKTYALCTGRLRDILEEMNVPFNPSGSGSRARYDSAVSAIRQILDGNNLSNKSSTAKDLENLGLLRDGDIISSSDIENSAGLRDSIELSISRMSSLIFTVDDITPNNMKKSILDACLQIHADNGPCVELARNIFRKSLDAIVKELEIDKNIYVVNSNFYRLSNYLFEIIHDDIGIYIFGRGSKINTMKIRIDF
jgi:hypothetical protein